MVVLNEFEPESGVASPTARLVPLSHVLPGEITDDLDIGK